MNPQKGLITEQNESQQVDYGNMPLGDVWTQNKETNRQSNISSYKAGRRTIFPIPSVNNDELINYLSNIVNKSTNMICLSSYMIQKSALTDALLAAARSRR